jgi:hypothetical protein
LEELNNFSYIIIKARKDENVTLRGSSQDSIILNVLSITGGIKSEIVQNKPIYILSQLLIRVPIYFEFSRGYFDLYHCFDILYVENLSE